MSSLSMTLSDFDDEFSYTCMKPNISENIEHIS